MSRYKMVSLSILILLLLGTFSVFAQERAGGIEGTVRGPNGAIVPNVSVRVASVGTTAGARPDVTIGFTRDLTTDENGFFRVLEVPPGFYSITVNATGFAPSTLNNVKVVSGKNTPVNIAWLSALRSRC